LLYFFQLSWVGIYITTLRVASQYLISMLVHIQINKRSILQVSI
jgi:hypothetical protein